MGDDKYIGSGSIFKRAVAKYGRHNFTKTILEISCIEDLNSLEIYYIKKYNAVKDKNFYNLSGGGLGKRGIRRFGKDNPFYGKTHTDLARKLISDANKNKKLSEEHKSRLINSRKGKRDKKSSILKRSGGNHYLYGKHLKAKSKKLISIKNTGKPSWCKGKTIWTKKQRQNIAKQNIISCKTKKAVLCVDLGRVFESARQAWRDTSIAYQSIWACCHGRRGKAGGYVWKYYEKV